MFGFTGDSQNYRDRQNFHKNRRIFKLSENCLVSLEKEATLKYKISYPDRHILAGLVKTLENFTWHPWCPSLLSGKEILR